MKYKSIINETDLVKVNPKLGSKSWSFIGFKTDRTVSVNGSFTEQVTYILGENYQEEDFLT
jgi:hypothetical protein